MLHWQENLAPDEMPPYWMWPLDEELAVWFERVVEERESRHGGGGGSSSGPDDGGSWSQNEYAKGRR